MRQFAVNCTFIPIFGLVMVLKGIFVLLMLVMWTVLSAQPIHLATANGAGIASGTDAVTLTSSDLPIVLIDTHGFIIMDSPKTAVAITIIDNGPGKRNSVTDAPAYSGTVGIELRGSSSQSFPKKSYGFETWNNANISIDTTLLGMPSESDWILNANYSDKSLMRNALAYQVWSNLGHYATRYRFVELVVNNDYQGVYIFSEKIKRDKNRVDISKLKPEETFGDPITGGYIIKIDKATGSGGPGWYSNFQPDNHPNGQSIFFQYDYPKASDITSSQRQYIQNFMANFESSLKSMNFADPDIGYRLYADEYSFIDYFLVNELSKNVDGYRLSTFMHKDRDSKGGLLKMGPVWDYDLAWHNADYCEADAYSGWAYQFPCTSDWWQPPFWWKRMLSDPRYADHLKCRYTDLRQTTLSNQWFDNYIDSVAKVLNESQSRNFARWPILGIYVWPNPWPYATTYQEEIRNMKSWLHRRLQWLDANMPGFCNPLSIDQPTAGINGLQVWPNPAKGRFFVGCDILPPGKVEISVLSIDGKIIFSAAAENLNKQHWRQEIDASRLKPGMYLVRLTSAANSSSRRIIVQ